MDPIFSPGAPWAAGDLDARTLDAPPPADFDCGAEEQNRFLHEWAWRDQRKGISVTHLIFVKGIAGAYVTLMADRIRLGPRERPKGVGYQLVPALKIAQLAVARRFAGYGLGRFAVGYAVECARVFCQEVGCRYVTLDAQPHLIAWYEAQGFRRNIEEQEHRRQLASERGRPAAEIPVSMRFDLREAI